MRIYRGSALLRLLTSSNKQTKIRGKGERANDEPNQGATSLSLFLLAFFISILGKHHPVLWGCSLVCLSPMIGLP